MFKKILFAALVAISASFAQINFGAHVGANMNTFWGDDTEDASSGIGFTAGLAMKISLPLLPITVAPEVLIDMRNITNEVGNQELTYTEWSLDIPVMVRFSLLPILYLEGGPVFAFNLSTSVEDEHDNEVKFDDDAFNTLDVGLALGIGTGIVPFLDIDFRVNMSFTNVQDDYEVAHMTVKAPDMSNLQFVIGATYWF